MSATVNLKPWWRSAMTELGISVTLEEKLLDASKSGNLEKVRDLLNKGANVNAKHADNGMTPLMNACKKGHLDVIQELLAHNADVDIEDNFGNKAIDYTSSRVIINLLQGKNQRSNVFNYYKKKPTVAAATATAAIPATLTRQPAMTINRRHLVNVSGGKRRHYKKTRKNRKSRKSRR